MVYRRFRLIAAALIATEVLASEYHDSAFCTLPPPTYVKASKTYPMLAEKLDWLNKYGIATWYTDRDEDGSNEDTARNIQEACDGSDKKTTVVVYGLPDKDCQAGHSQVGSRVTNADEYGSFIDTIVAATEKQKPIYIFEPDAIGLYVSKDTDCGIQADYVNNMITAVEKLSQNEHAEIYVDCGYWTLEDDEQRQQVVEQFKLLAEAGSKVKGITINTSNYRTNDELEELCEKFVNDAGTAYGCIFDTSRNGNGPSDDDEWCNYKGAGIGDVPQEIGGDNCHYKMWIKPQGDSDCKHEGNGYEHPQSIENESKGAGVFFPELFQILWNDGYPVRNGGQAPVADTEIVEYASPVETLDYETPDFEAEEKDTPETTSESYPTVSTDEPIVTKASESSDNYSTVSTDGPTIVEAPEPSQTYASTPTLTPHNYEQEDTPVATEQPEYHKPKKTARPVVEGEYKNCEFK